MFWCDLKDVFKFARIAYNRVRCTRAREQGFPLHYFSNCTSFIWFIFIIKFMPLPAGGWYPPLRVCGIYKICFNIYSVLLLAGVRWTPLLICNIYKILFIEYFVWLLVPYIKNSRETMFCILHAVFPTIIFHFPFSTFNLIIFRSGILTLTLTRLSART